MAEKSPNEPPTTQVLIDEFGLPTLAWILFFSDLSRGDLGQYWTPRCVGLDDGGQAPTITGLYYRLSRRLAYISVRIIPETGTSATAGITYIDNFPLKIIGDGACLAVSGLQGFMPGMIEATTTNHGGRIYVPSWQNVAMPITIIGLAEVQ